MNQKQCEDVTAALVEVVVRVSEDENASPAEIAALPEIARALCELTTYSAM